MDQDRQIRLAIAPFFLFASLLWGAYLGHVDLGFLFKPETAKDVLGVLAAAAVAVIPLGFLIGTVSICLVRLIVCVIDLSGLSENIGTYEARISPYSYKRVWTQIDATGGPDPKEALYAAATFDHEMLKPGVHTWIMRRWSSFNVAVHSATALLLAYYVAAPSLNVPHTRQWLLWTVGLVTLMVYHASVAWRETMNMLEFQSGRERKPEK